MHDWNLSRRGHGFLTLIDWNVVVFVVVVVGWFG